MTAGDASEDIVARIADIFARRGAEDYLGEAVTMADLFWGIELLRMRNVGAATYWEGGRAPAVERFLARIETLPAIRAAILDWPGAMF